MVNGDFCAHGYALDPWNRTFNISTWNEMKEVIREDMKMIRKYYNNTDLLPTIGNNDVVIHNNVPSDNQTADIYYSELYQIWFNESTNFT